MAARYDKGENMQVNRWKKPGRCETSACVEVKLDDDGLWHVRDSKHPVVTLTFTTPEWDAFVAGAKEGEFDV